MEQGEIERRVFLNRVIMFGLCTSVGIGATSSQADICRWCQLSKLSPQRFIAGLIFDTLRAIMVDYVSRKVVNNLIEQKLPNSSSGGLLSNSSPVPTNEYYKGALIVAGETDYELHRNHLLKNTLFSSKEEQFLRLEQIKQYLKENDIYIKSAYTSISYPIDGYTTEDDLLSIEYFTSPSQDLNDKIFLAELEEITGVSALRKWTNG